MQTKYLCVLFSIWTKGKVGAVKPVCASSEIFLLSVPRRYFFCYFCLVFVMLSCASVY